MESSKSITWFKGDNYEDFCLIQDGDKILKCVVEQDLAFDKFILKAGVGYKVDPDYIERFTSTNTGWSISELENIMKLEYHFPKFVYIESFDSLKQAQDFIDDMYQLNLKEKEIEKQAESPNYQLSLLNNKKLSDFPNLDSLFMHILKATTFMSLLN